jgi:hypothetical protein
LFTDNNLPAEQARDIYEGFLKAEVMASKLSSWLAKAAEEQYSE